MSTDLIITAAVLGFGLLSAFTAYWEGYNRGTREANARHRSRQRHPSGPTNLRVVSNEESA